MSPIPLKKKDEEEEPSNFGLAHVFKYEQLKKATNSFDTELGNGGYGRVYLGTLPDGREVAVKELFDDPKRLEQFFNEVTLLPRLRHKNLITLYGCTNPLRQHFFLVYDYVPNGTVAEHLHCQRSDLTLAVRIQIAAETAAALSYLHALEPPIIHRDVKTSNILLDNALHAKLADLGICRHLPWDATHVLTQPQGTLGYRDPDYDRTFLLTDKSDVYSLGVVLVELISGQLAVDVSRNPEDIYLDSLALKKILNKKLKDFVDPKLGYRSNHDVKRVIKSVAELARECLHPRGCMRPSMVEVLCLLKKIQEKMLEMGQNVVDVMPFDPQRDLGYGNLNNGVERERVTVETEDLITVKGTVDVTTLPALQEELNRGVEVVPPKKDDGGIGKEKKTEGGGGEKKKKGCGGGPGADNKEGDSGGGGEKRKKECGSGGGADEKNDGGGGGGEKKKKGWGGGPGADNKEGDSGGGGEKRKKERGSGGGADEKNDGCGGGGEKKKKECGGGAGADKKEGGSGGREERKKESSGGGGADEKNGGGGHGGEERKNEGDGGGGTHNNNYGGSDGDAKKPAGSVGGERDGDAKKPAGSVGGERDGKDQKKPAGNQKPKPPKALTISLRIERYCECEGCTVEIVRNIRKVKGVRRVYVKGEGLITVEGTMNMTTFLTLLQKKLKKKRVEVLP